MTTKFQHRILEAYRDGRCIVHGKYCYSIQYHPHAANHTWIIRRPNDPNYNNWPGRGWVFVQPLDPDIY